jgi:hypothetical protein
MVMMMGACVRARTALILTGGGPQSLVSEGHEQQVTIKLPAGVRGIFGPARRRFRNAAYLPGHNLKPPEAANALAGWIRGGVCICLLGPQLILVKLDNHQVG